MAVDHRTPRTPARAPARKSARLLLLALAALTLAAAANLPTVWEPPAPHPGPAAEPRSRVLAAHSTLGDLYESWEAGYVEAGGDRSVTLTLGHARGLPGSLGAGQSAGAGRGARGRLTLDLVGGTVRAELEGLGDEPVDLWLVDNQPGPGHSALPEAGDRKVRLGRLTPRGGTARLRRSLGEGFFRGFELDLAVLTRAGEGPEQGGLLWGSRPYFERLHTRARRGAETAATGSGWDLPVASLLRGLAPRAAEAAPSAAPASVLVSRGLITQQVAEGADLFFRATFGGNGRTCGTCHRLERNLGLDPEFIAGLPDDDPLFVAERPAEQGGVPGLEIPEMVRRFGLILENMDGLEDPTAKFVLRGVPHTQSMARSVLAPTDDGRAPVERTGWSGDGAPLSGALRFFAVGAITQHLTRSLDRVPGVDFVLPTDEELDALEAYLLATGRLLDTRLASLIMADPRVEAGREAFLGTGKCFRCHSRAGAISGFGGNRNENTGIEKLPHPARRVLDFPRDGGFGREPLDQDGDGVFEAFGDGTFNIPPLVEAADTAPFFHNDVVETLEEAVAFYDSEEFNTSPGADRVGGIDLTPQEIDDLAAFLRVMNAAFNLDLARQRTAAARSLAGGPLLRGSRLSAGTPAPDGGASRATADTLLALANLEAADAIEVLDARGLHPEVVELLLQAIAANEAALATPSPRGWRNRIDEALAHLEAARPLFGRNLIFVLGEGNLAF